MMLAYLLRADRRQEYFFVIDGKLSPTMMNKRKWQDQQHNDEHGKIRTVNSRSQGSNSRQKILKCDRSEHVKDSILEFRSREIGVSDTGSWRSQESRLFITGVRSCEMRNAEILKQAHQQRVSQTGK
jgi:hypothetical protein